MPRRATKPQPIGYDGRFEPSFLEVPDPFEPDKTLTVAANVRHDVILFLYKRIYFARLISYNIVNPYISFSIVLKSKLF